MIKAFSFINQKPEVICPKLEAYLLDELKNGGTVSYTVEDQTDKKLNVGDFVKDSLQLVFGGHPDSLFRVRFNINYSGRQFELTINILRHSNRAYVGAINFSIPIKLKVKSDIELDSNKDTFTGNDAYVGILNANKQFLQAAVKIAPTQGILGNGTRATIPRFLKVLPKNVNSLLVFNTFIERGFFFFKGFRIDSALAFADLIEQN